MEANGETEILAGLREGEKVVASGQFLIDSEASLSGVMARPIGGPTAKAPTGSAVYESTGRIEQIAAASVTLSHAPVPALNRSEARRAGKEGVRTCRPRGSPEH